MRFPRSLRLAERLARKPDEECEDRAPHWRGWLSGGSRVFCCLVRILRTVSAYLTTVCTRATADPAVPLVNPLSTNPARSPSYRSCPPAARSNSSPRQPSQPTLSSPSPPCSCSHDTAMATFSSTPIVRRTSGLAADWTRQEEGTQAEGELLPVGREGERSGRRMSWDVQGAEEEEMLAEFFTLSGGRLCQPVPRQADSGVLLALSKRTPQLTAYTNSSICSC